MKNSTHEIVSDDDGHHYVIPRDKGTEFEMWLTAVTEYWSPYSRTQHQGDVPEKPNWADEVGGSPSQDARTLDRIATARVANDKAVRRAMERQGEERILGVSCLVVRPPR